MALVPGLRAFREDRPDVGRGFRPRAEARDSLEGNLPRLRPTASPVNTMVQPTPPAQGGGELEALARGLASLNPVLARYAEVEGTERRQQADADARARLGGMTFDEARQAVDRGDMPEMSNPWFRAAFMRQFGERTALWRAGQQQTAYENGFDRRNGDIEEFIARPAAEDLAGAYGQDPHFRAGYGGAYTRFANQLRAHQTQFSSRETQTDVMQGVYESFLGVARDGLANNRTPQEIHDAMRARYQGNRDLLRVDFRTQDAEMLRAARALAAEGRYDLVQEILQGNRGGLGPLANVREHAQAASQILELADRERRQRNAEGAQGQRFSFHDAAAAGTLDSAALRDFARANPGSFSDAQILSLEDRNRSVQDQARRRNETEARRVAVNAQYDDERTQLTTQDFLAGAEGGLAFIATPARVHSREDLEHGRAPSQEISASERRQNAIQMFLRNSAQIARDREETPEQTFNREAEWFTRNAQVNPQWQQVLQQGYIAASGPTTDTRNGPPPPALAASMELYRRLHASNPRLLRAHVSDNTALEFYDSVRVGVEFGGMELPQAFAAAQAITRDPTNLNTRSNQIRMEDVRRQVNGLGREWWQVLGGQPENAGMLNSEIERMAGLYIGMGLSPERAIEQARTRISATYTNINGWMVPNADRQLPPNFADLATGRLRQYVAEHGEAEGVTLSDLTIRPVNNGTGAWAIVHRQTGMPVGEGSRYFSLRDLMSDDERRRETERERLSNEANERLRIQRLGPNAPVGSQIGLGGTRPNANEPVGAASGLTRRRTPPPLPGGGVPTN